MTQSGKSLFFFGIYVFGTGLLFLLVPDTLVDLMQLPSVPSGWGRFIGLLAMVTGSYDIFAGQSNIQPVIKISVFIRLGFAVGAVLLFAFGQMPVSIILLGGADALGALWTASALRSEASKN